MVVRVAIGLVAVVIVGWLAVLERDTRLTARAVTASGRLSTSGNFARADAGFRAARLLNPDTTPDQDRAILYEGAGRSAAATGLVQDVLRREPDNLAAWALLYTFARDRDPALARQAVDARRRLDPFNARPRAR